ncbi:arginine/lysine/ornithine decarboxylase [Paenibacillus castaneae]|uniref:aminotransferase class I/II-fold pyridoxal phosphate-dependent enzyme n=1 Tax=Paenibacillus castaneae TaxID=474957 RepID=UPI000C9AE821|nr:aminotransferase class I/II-fold pyridoxal phosphate-dependent enzyme [Paenibacillus castaneae]NIK80057.1 arginine/lysine/ornithine decarboxylase [Paenibacillus castaneae]
MKQFYAPLLEALIDHINDSPAGFHVPGHHYGQALAYELQNAMPEYHPSKWFSEIMMLDVTELSSTDDLHHPERSIKEAQLLAAHTFGADETFFLVGGSTSGNIALLLALCDQDDIIIVQRNVHKSILNGLRLAGAKAVFLSPQIELSSSLAVVPSLEQVEEALQLYPEAKAVFLSNPNYYGMGVKLTPYSELIHKYGKPLLVDEAHGAHFGFHSQLPLSALAEGADAVVQSAHKTLPALTMGAMLHVQGDRMDRQLLRQSLAMIQSSSPSFPILASLDISRAMIDALGEELFKQSLSSAASFRRWLAEQSTHIKSLELSLEKDNQIIAFADPLRVVLYDKSGIFTGFELQQRLEKFNIYVEMADPRYVVLVFGIGTSLEDIMKLENAIITTNRDLNEINSPAKLKLNPLVYDAGHAGTAPTISKPVSFARSLFSRRRMERIQLAQAEHRMAAEMVTPYPPGISILYPGEIITAEGIEQIQYLARTGAKFQGANDQTMNTIAVYE